MMHLIVYISKFSGEDSRVDSVLADITAKSVVRNKKCGITGLLFFHEGHFLQLIEGDQAAVEGLMDRLEKDPRHHSIERIVDEPIVSRSFSEWRMDTVHLDQAGCFEGDVLMSIRDLYKKTYTMDSGDFVLFFKMILESRIGVEEVVLTH